MNKIEYPLSKDQKEKFRQRLNVVLDRNEGTQVIILWDKDKLTDYYQNICIKCLMKEIRGSAKEYKKITNGVLLT